MARETEAALVGEVLASWDDEESGCWVLRAACCVRSMQHRVRMFVVPDSRKGRCVQRVAARLSGSVYVQYNRTLLYYPTLEILAEIKARSSAIVPRIKRSLCPCPHPPLPPRLCPISRTKRIYD